MRALCGMTLALTLVAACGEGDDEPAGKELAKSTGEFVLFDDPFMNGQPNPATGIKGSAEAREVTGKGMRLQLSVSGLPKARAFGAHLHKLACADMKAGGHYQHMQSPGMANDPMYANAMNEIWLDFTTDDKGAASVSAEVAWVPRASEAKSIVVHDMKTVTGGTAGAKLACLSIAF